jgi:hypothetical protein
LKWSGKDDADALHALTAQVRKLTVRIFIVAVAVAIVVVVVFSSCLLS